MKKLAILGASAALAAMPVVGVFATQSTDQHPAKQVTDNITVTIDAGCTMSRADTDETLVPASGNIPAYYTIQDTVDFGTMTPGTVKTAAGEQVNVVCNGASAATSGTWILQAHSGEVSNNAAILKNGDGSETITTAADASLDGNASGWGFKIANNTGESSGVDAFVITTGYSNYTTVPATDTAIATMSYVTTGDPVPTTSGEYAFTPSYKISIADDQAATTYTGSVIYTIAQAAS